MSTFAPAGHPSTPSPSPAQYTGGASIEDPPNTTWDINDPDLPPELKAAVAAWQASETSEP